MGNGRRARGSNPILNDLLEAFDHVAYQKLIDAAVRTRFPVRQLKLLLPLYQTGREVELDGVAGEALKAQRGIIPVCAFATTLLWLLLVGPLTARKLKVLHLSRQTLKHNIFSSINVLRSIRQLQTHHELPMTMRMKMSETTKCQSRHIEAKEDSDGRNCKRVTGTVATCEFIEIF